MKPFELYRGDCRALLDLVIPDNSIDSIVTDPPYELGFMGKGWDATGVANDVETWRQALRVLKPGGHLLAFSGTRTYHRMVCAIEDAGFEIRDQIGWVYGSGFPKSRNIAEADMRGEDAARWAGWGTALKPAWEPIVVARKPLVGTVAANVLQHGTGALNIDGCRVEGPGGVKWEKPRGGIWSTDSEAKAALVQNDLGRWPANIIHDGSDEVLAAFPDSNGSGAARTLKRGGRSDGWGMGDEPGELRDAGTGSAARFFYCAKASRRDRNNGLDDPGPQFKKGSTLRDAENLNASGERRGNTHPTVKPTELMRYLCRLVTPPGGTVLDLFTGSGSTGKAAVLEGFHFIGCELSDEYIAIATARIHDAIASTTRNAA